jgi:hypothetical protein
MLPVPDQTSDQIERTLMAIARELAMDLNPLDLILNAHGINPEAFENHRNTPRFQAMLAEQIRLWEAADNVEARVKMKFLTSTEMAIPQMYASLHDTREPLSARVELFKTFQKGAGLLDRAAENMADKVTITINLGAERQPVTIEAQVTQPVTRDALEVIDVEI